MRLPLTDVATRPCCKHQERGRKPPRPRRAYLCGDKRNLPAGRYQLTAATEAITITADNYASYYALAYYGEDTLVGYADENKSQEVYGIGVGFYHLRTGGQDDENWTKSQLEETIWNMPF